MTVDCTGSDFADLRNAYTGEPMKVKMLVSKNMPPRFFCPGTYSTHNRYGTARAAYDAWAQKDGVGGVRRGKEIRCAYTGELLEPKHDETGHWFDGGFDPHRLWTREEFLRLASMRDGIGPAPVAPVRAEAVPPEPDHKVRSHETEVLPEMADCAGKIAEKVGISRKTVVGGRGKGRRNG